MAAATRGAAPLASCKTLASVVVFAAGAATQLLHRHRGGAHNRRKTRGHFSGPSATAAPTPSTFADPRPSVGRHALRPAVSFDEAFQRNLRRWPPWPRGPPVPTWFPTCGCCGLATCAASTEPYEAQWSASDVRRVEVEVHDEHLRRLGDLVLVENAAPEAAARAEAPARSWPSAPSGRGRRTRILRPPNSARRAALDPRPVRLIVGLSPSRQGPDLDDIEWAIVTVPTWGSPTATSGVVGLPRQIAHVDVLAVGAVDARVVDDDVAFLVCAGIARWWRRGGAAAWRFSLCVREGASLAVVVQGRRVRDRRHHGSSRGSPTTTRTGWTR